MRTLACTAALVLTCAASCSGAASGECNGDGCEEADAADTSAPSRDIATDPLADTTPADTALDSAADVPADTAADTAPDLGEDVAADVDTGDTAADSSDAAPDVMLPDGDGDGVPDENDAFPTDPLEWDDSDLDGIGDNADTDDDNDGLSDDEETTYGADCMLSHPARPDTDADDIPDAEDPYPRDPFPEFMLRRNDVGTIDLFLSNRDGTFREPVAIGEPIDHMGNPLTYGGFAIGDFDADGVMDFVANTSPLVDGEPTRRFYFFYRDVKEDEFNQVFIGETDRYIAGAVTDANGDFLFDIVRMQLERPDYISGGTVYVYLNNNGGPTATCVWSADPADMCFFTAMPGIDVTSTVGGEWTARMGVQAVDLNPAEDGFDDLTLITFASGGNARTNVYTLFGDGAGGYGAPVEQFIHNNATDQAPANSIIFADLDGDSVGDLALGFDDDGQAGNLWTYVGDGAGGFSTTAIDAVDLNPGDASEVGGGEELGRTGSGRGFDVDFDGNVDLMVGYRHMAYDQPGQTRLYMGNGDGTFGPEFTVIGAESTSAEAFELPRRLCPDFALIDDE